MITIKSHGFKYSRPDANIIADVSYFKNPWRDDSIRNATPEERKELIMSYMKEQKGVERFVTQFTEWIFTYHILFPKENIQVAICCSAGEYRSPAIVELIAERLRIYYVVDFVVEHSKNSKL